MKTKLIFVVLFVITGLWLVISRVQAFSLLSPFGGGKTVSKSVFPQDITDAVDNEYPQDKPVKLVEVFSTTEKGAVGGYTANYSGRDYWVYSGIIQMKDNQAATEKANGWLEARKKVFEDPEHKKQLDVFKTEWGNIFHWKVAGYEVTTLYWGEYTNAKCDMYLSCTPINHAMMFAPVENYLVFIEVTSSYYYPKTKSEEAAKAHVNQAQALFELFVKQLKAGGTTGETSQSKGTPQASPVELSDSVFPLELVSLPRQTAYQMTADDLSDYWGKLYEVTKAYLVTYYKPPEDSSAFHLFVQAFQLKEEKRTLEYLKELSDLTKKDLEEKSSDKCEAIQEDLVSGYGAKYFVCTSSGDPKDYNHKLDLFVAARNYLVWVKLSQDAPGLKLTDAEEAASAVLVKLGLTKIRAKDSSGNLIDQVVAAIKNRFSGPQPETVKKSLPDLTLLEKLNFQEKKTECGDKSCDVWAGENCQICPLDCQKPGSCCAPEFSFTYPISYHSQDYQLYKSDTGNIPEGMMLVRTGTSESDLFSSSFKPAICINGQAPETSCRKNNDCAKGVCKYGECIQTVTTENNFREVTDSEIQDQIIYEQVDYVKEFVNATVKLRGGGIYQEKGPGFEVKLLVFGESDNNEYVEAIKGKPIETRLEIRSISSYNITIYPRIFYTRGLEGEEDTELTSQIEELKYTLSAGGGGIVASFFGSSQAKPLAGNHLLLPPGAKATIFSKVIPREKGMIFAKAKILFNSELKEVSKGPKLVWVDKTPEEFERQNQKTELRVKVYIAEPNCSFWGLLCM